MESSLNKLVSSKGFILNKVDRGLVPCTLHEFISMTTSLKYLIGLDIGKQKCGVAISENLSNIAMPLKIVPTKMLFNYLKTINSNIGSYGLVAGLPLTLSGDLGASSVTTCNVINGLSDLINTYKLPLWFHDERFTTIRIYSSLNHTKSKFSKLVDDLCAMEILQEHLDLRKAQVIPDSQG